MACRSLASGMDLDMSEVYSFLSMRERNFPCNFLFLHGWIDYSEKFLSNHQENHMMNHKALPLIVMVFMMMVFHLHPSASLLVTPPRSILVRPETTIQTEEDVDRLVSLCEKYRISNIFLLVKQDSGPDSGLVYYNSMRIPNASQFDVLFRVIDKAHERNIKVYAWLPLLYDKRASQAGLGTGGDWISPFKATSYYAAIVNEVVTYYVDGILFDYVQFPDEFTASEELKTSFGDKYGYNMAILDLKLEKERNTPLWNRWLAYRNEVLSMFITNIIPKAVPVGLMASPEVVQNLGPDSPIFSSMRFVAARVQEDPASLINRLTLFTGAEAFVILPNEYVREVRQLLSESIYADTIIFESNTWSESDFKRIKKAEIPFNDVQLTRLPFIDFFNNAYDMEKWRSHEINTVILPAGRVFWTYFKYEPYKEKWSLYTEKYGRDFVDEMISQAQKNGLYAVLELDIQSEEYVNRYKDAASITYQWGSLRKRICLSELNNEPYKTEFLEMARYLANNYEAEAILISNIAYYEDCFCDVCLKSYIAFMTEQGTIVEDWPRVDGEINILDRTILNWKTAQLSAFLKDVRDSLRESNKELWVEVPVSSDLEYTSSEYGLNLPDIEPIVDRIVFTNIDIQNPPRVGVVAKAMNTQNSIFYFYINSSPSPAREYLVDSLKLTYSNDIKNVGVYPHWAMTDNLWGAFYIAYSYKLAITSEELMELYGEGAYENVISRYFVLVEEKREEERQIRDKARQNILEAKNVHERVLQSLEEARQIDVDVTTFEMDIEKTLDLISDAETLFISGDYDSAEQKGKTAIVEFSTLNLRLERLVREERINRVTSGVLIIVVFMLIMMYIGLRLRRKHAR